MREIVDDSFDTLRHRRRAEIQQEAERKAGQFEIREHLPTVDTRGLLESLQLDKDTRFNDDIDAIRTGDDQVVVYEVHGNIELELKASPRELVGQAGCIRGFEAPRPDTPVHGNAAPNHLVCDLILSSLVTHARR